MSQTIVCVDDEAGICGVLRAVLRETGATVETFTDPQAALAFLQSHDVALVVCDYRMPTMSGLYVLERLPKPVPFLMMSGDLEIELFSGVKGVTGVVAKPFSAGKLIERAKGYLGEG